MVESQRAPLAASPPHHRLWGAVGVVSLGVVLVLLYLLSRSNYLLFHAIIELFAIVVGCAIFVVAWNTRRWVSNDYLLFLGIAYLFVAIIDVFHTLAFKGMGVFPAFGANEPTQFWILARYIEAFSLLAAPLFLTRRLRLAPVVAVYALVTGFGLLSIYRLGIFPDCFVDGQGLTAFKVASEYAISAVLVGGIVFLSRHRKTLEPRVFRLLVVAMVATIAAEMSFTLYTDVYGIANMVGHLLKVVSFYLVYRAVVVTSLATPYETLFREVSRSRDEARMYLDMAGTILVVIDREGKVQLVNRRGADVLGYAETEILGHDWFKHFLPESRRKHAYELFGQLMQGDITTAEYTEGPVMTSEGGERLIAWHSAVLRDDRGAIVGTLSSGEDVTELKRAEDALRGSEEKFRALFEQSMDAIYMHAYDGSNMEANQAWLDLFDWTAAELPFIDSARDVYVDPHDRDDFLRRIGATGVVADEVRFKKKDGTVIICQRTVVARRDESGAIVAFQGIIRDITGRKNAEEATLRSEARLRSLVSILQHESDTVQDFLDYALNEAIVLTESKIGYIYFYDEERREFTLNTWSRDVMKECIIQEAQTVYSLDKTGIWGEAVRQRRPIVVNDFAAPHRLKKGYPEGHAALRKYATVPVVSLGRIVAVVGVANKETDYTDTDVLELTLLMDSVWKEVERKQIQEQVRQFSERLTQAMSAGNLAWWQMALPSGKVVFDERKATMLDYSPSDFSHYTDFTALLHPDDLEKAMQAMRDHLEGSAERYEVEYRIRTSSGEYRWFRDVGGITERDSEGKPSLITGIVVDITGLKSAEERLAESNRSLRDLAARLDVAREEERASVAWELHDEVAQALSVIRLDITSCSAQLPADARAQTEATMERIVGLLDATIGRLRRLYTDLVPVMLEDLGLAAAIEWQTEQFAGETAAAVRVGRVEDLTLRDERTTLGMFRILQELLDHVSTHPGATNVTVDLEREDSNAVLLVTDDGYGFERAECEESCALLLAGIRERARFWDGEVTVSNIPSKGTVVRVTAPLQRD